MASNYPTSLDTATELPSPTKYQHIDASGVEHHALETNQSTAILALETKVGITGSGVTTTLDYRITVLEGLVPASGSGTPEGAVTGSPGKMYLDISVDPPALWAKYSGAGNTGWRQLIA